MRPVSEAYTGLFSALMDLFRLSVTEGRASPAFRERVESPPAFVCDGAERAGRYWREAFRLAGEGRSPAERRFCLDSGLIPLLREPGLSREETELLLLIRQTADFLAEDDWEGFLSLSNLWTTEAADYACGSFFPALPEWFLQERRLESWLPQTPDNG